MKLSSKKLWNLIARQCKFVESKAQLLIDCINKLCTYILAISGNSTLPSINSVSSVKPQDTQFQIQDTRHAKLLLRASNLLNWKGKL